MRTRRIFCAYVNKKIEQILVRLCIFNKIYGIVQFIFQKNENIKCTSIISK